jgi:hypothetical protein
LLSKKRHTYGQQNNHIVLALYDVPELRYHQDYQPTNGEKNPKFASISHQFEYLVSTYPSEITKAATIPKIVRWSEETQFGRAAAILGRLRFSQGPVQVLMISFGFLFDFPLCLFPLIIFHMQFRLLKNNQFINKYFNKWTYRHPQNIS